MDKKGFLERVERFARAMEQQDNQGISHFFSYDADYSEVLWKEPLYGRKAIAHHFGTVFSKRRSTDFIISKIVFDEGRGAIEWTQIFIKEDTQATETHLGVAIVEVKDGEFSSWRDYILRATKLR